SLYRRPHSALPALLPAAPCRRNYRIASAIRRPARASARTNDARPALYPCMAHGCTLTPAARPLDSSVDCRAAGISLISRAAATPTLRAYQSALRAAGIRRVPDLALRFLDRDAPVDAIFVGW